MTFADHATDLATVLLAELGESVTVAIAGEADQDVTAWRVPRQPEVYTGAVLASQQRLAWCMKAADLTDLPGPGDTIEDASGVAWRIIKQGGLSPGRSYLDDAQVILIFECEPPAGLEPL